VSDSYTDGVWNLRPMPLCTISNSRRPVSSSPLKRTCPELGVVRPGDEVEQRRLARAVGADDRADLVLVDVDVEVVDRLESVEGDAQPLDLEEVARVLGVMRAGLGHGALLRSGDSATGVTGGSAAAVLGRLFQRVANPFTAR